MKNILIVFSILFVICSCNDDKKERISPLRLDSMHGVYELDTHKSVGISINECIEQKNEEYIHYMVADFSREDSCHFYQVGADVKKMSFAYSFDNDNITLIDKNGNKIEFKLKKLETGKDYIEYFFEKVVGNGLYEYRSFRELRNNYSFENFYKELKGEVSVPKDRLWSRKDICGLFCGRFFNEDPNIEVYRRYSKNGTFKEAIRNIANSETEYSNGTYRLEKYGEVDTMYLNYENGKEKVECISYDIYQYYVIEADTISGFFTDDDWVYRADIGI